ncbi:MAG: hypothetical protein Ct9H90mP6_05250 [Gammaproteobacteria bacterium]|nr:MAG: hypothetical protein Ct9H90mP6_05250 [Gammaproteobacteria bacterium]
MSLLKGIGFMSDNHKETVHSAKNSLDGVYIQGLC